AAERPVLRQIQEQLVDSRQMLGVCGGKQVVAVQIAEQQWQQGDTAHEQHFKPACPANIRKLRLCESSAAKQRRGSVPKRSCPGRRQHPLDAVIEQAKYKSALVIAIGNEDAP